MISYGDSKPLDGTHSKTFKHPQRDTKGLCSTIVPYQPSLITHLNRIPLVFCWIIGSTMVQPLFPPQNPYPWRIRMYGRLMPTFGVYWWSMLPYIIIYIYSIHTDPMGMKSLFPVSPSDLRLEEPADRSIFPQVELHLVKPARKMGVPQGRWLVYFMEQSI